MYKRQVADRRLVRRIEQAKARLSAGATLAEVAEALGYCDQFFFARQFKTVTGQSPGARRKTFMGVVPGLPAT